MNNRLIQARSGPAALVFPLVYMMGVIALSSIPGVIPEDAPIPYQIFIWVPPALQNLLHIPVYAGLAFLWSWSLAPRMKAPWLWLLPLMLTVGFGVFDEWYQSFVPGRYASLSDVLLNTTGALLGVAVFCWLRSRVAKG